MQTFLPYADFEQSAQVLDVKRLGKQRVECLQLLRYLLEPSNRRKGFANHPAKLMWRGFENSLVNYTLVICDEWVKRGYKDTCYNKAQQYFNKNATCDVPVWLGDERLHSSHRSNLLRKNYEFYSKFGWVEGPELPYMWPLVDEDGSVDWRSKHSANSQFNNARKENG